ncbi:MAG: BCSC C-terminal domain-containing protein [Rhodoferax sp.]|nr:BCSC C-terminal domain-containing protein [Rhodoferax sp.]
MKGAPAKPDTHRQFCALYTALMLGVAMGDADAATIDPDGLRLKMSAQLANEPARFVLKRAELALETGSPQVAEKLLSRAMRAYPDNADVVGAMGGVRLRQEQHASAYALFTQALRLTQGENDKWRSLAQTARYWQLLKRARDARRSQDYEVAGKLVREAIALDAKTSDAYAILGAIQADQGQLGAALANYRLALTHKPLNVAALEGVTALYRRQDMAQAERWIARLTPAQRKVLGTALQRIMEQTDSPTSGEEISEPITALLRDAEAHMDRKEFAAAEALLVQALQAHPDHPELIGGMGMLQLRQENHAQAHTLFTRALELTQGKSGKWKSLIATARYWQLLRQARDARQARDFNAAEAHLKDAIALDAKIADAYAILGGIQMDRSQISAATATYRQALAIYPLNSESLEGLIELNNRQGLTQAQRFVAQLTPAQRELVSTDIRRMEIAATEIQVNDPDDFLSGLERIGVEDRPEQISKPWGNTLEKVISAHIKAGRRGAAVALAQEAQALAVGDEIASLAVAASWAKLGDYAKADVIFDALRRAKSPPSAHWRLRRAAFLSLRDAPELREELETIAAMPSLTSEQTAELYELQLALALRTAKAHLNAGDPALARQTLAPYLNATPNRSALLLLAARTYQAEKQWEQAQSLYTQLLQVDPGDAWALRGEIEIKVATGERAAALQQLDQLTALASDLGPENGAAMVDLYLKLDALERARPLTESLLEQYPNQPLILHSAAQLAHRSGNSDEEIVYLKRSLASERTPRAIGDTPTSAATPMAVEHYQHIGFEDLDSTKKITRDWKEKKLAVLMDRRTPWFASAIELRNRNGTSGLSQLDVREVPMEFRTPWSRDGEATLRADLLRLDAGLVAPDNARFGSMVLCQPQCAVGLLGQAEQGTALAVGYQRGGLSADVGLTPQNFPVSNTVGGIRYRGAFDTGSYAVEFSRRPISDSLLSMAGTIDPGTGKAWGGVVATGATLSASLDSGTTWSFWSSLGLHALTGQDVQFNRRVQGTAGAQWRIVNQENRQLLAGLTGTTWGFAHNSGEYTLGHGGYFSPSSYRSLTIPISYTARSQRFSYLLQASYSSFSTRMQEAPMYPLDLALQGKAMALGTLQAIYPGQDSQGTGYSFAAAWEYQLTQRLFFGGQLSVERAGTYAPNQALVYLRYAIDQPAAQPVFMPPQPLVPLSQRY